jgi:hypothetical protein
MKTEEKEKFMFSINHKLKVDFLKCIYENKAKSSFLLENYEIVH